MNGKKAKRLRREAAGDPSEVKYHEYWPPQFEEEKDDNGLVISITKTLHGRPRVLNECHRRNYKDLKNPVRAEKRERFKELGVTGMI